MPRRLNSALPSYSSLMDDLGPTSRDAATVTVNGRVNRIEMVVIISGCLKYHTNWNTRCECFMFPRLRVMFYIALNSH